MYQQQQQQLSFIHVMSVAARRGQVTPSLCLYSRYCDERDLVTCDSVTVCEELGLEADTLAGAQLLLGPITL